MPRDKENGRKRRYSDVLTDLYKGPQEFMEAGTRGFLITSIPDREEHSIDETVKVLRKTCVKLYGGVKPLRREDASFAKGYIMIDFMDPETVVCLPNPDAEKVAEEEKAKVAEEEATKEEGKETEEMEHENKQEQEEEAKPEGEPEVEGAGDEKEKTEAEGDAETTTEEAKETKPVEEKEKDEKKKKEDTRRRRDEEKKPLMLAPYKFNAYRTELRNIMFIKSDIPDPVEVVNACFDMMLARKPLYTDCVNQLLPVQGVCDNDYKQLEIMCRRVLVPYFGEHLEEPPSFGVMLINKMCEPGAEVLLEVVRSAIWCLNPCAWQCSPWAEPDVVVHIEIIGSKIILSAMPHYMKYRQYSPFAVHELGSGKPEDEEQLLKEIKEENNSKENKEKGGRSGKGRDRKDGRGKDREDKKKQPEKDQEEKKEAGEEANKDTENTENVEKEQGVEEVKEELPEESAEPSTEMAEEEKKVSPEKKSTRGKSQKSKS